MVFFYETGLTAYGVLIEVMKCTKIILCSTNFVGLPQLQSSEFSSKNFRWFVTRPDHRGLI